MCFFLAFNSGHCAPALPAWRQVKIARLHPHAHFNLRLEVSTQSSLEQMAPATLANGSLPCSWTASLTMVQEASQPLQELLHREMFELLGVVTKVTGLVVVW